MKIGDTLYYVPVSQWQQARELVVTKVGRVWAEVSGTGPRVQWRTLEMDEYGSRGGRYYLSREAYEAEQARSAAWAALRKGMDRWSVPDGVTIADIEQAMALLKLTSQR